MRKQRMTEEEYIEAKIELEKIDEEIKKLKQKRTPIFNKVRWYEYSGSKNSTRYRNGYAYQRFGKRAKDLDDEERKIYNRELAAESRRRKKNEC